MNTSLGGRVEEALKSEEAFAGAQGWGSNSSSLVMGCWAMRFAKRQALFYSGTEYLMFSGEQVVAPSAGRRKSAPGV